MEQLFSLEESQFIQLSNPTRSIAYVEREASNATSLPPLILLHGFLDNAASFVRLFEVRIVLINSQFKI
jgi:pimeloyl-ACP methyl ester carboxylesterase